MPFPLEFHSWPTQKRSRELLVQHWFGRSLMDSARDYAWDRIPRGASKETVDLSKKAAMDAIYGLMMLLEGVTGTAPDKEHYMEFRLTGRIVDKEGALIEEHEIAPDGEGLCMGYHGWAKGDFGEFLK